MYKRQQELFASFWRGVPVIRKLRIKSSKEQGREDASGCQCCVLGNWLHFGRPKISAACTAKQARPGEGLLALCCWVQSSEHSFMLKSGSRSNPNAIMALHRLSTARYIPRWLEYFVRSKSFVLLSSPYLILLLVAVIRFMRLKEQWLSFQIYLYFLHEKSVCDHSIIILGCWDMFLHKLYIYLINQFPEHGWIS